MTYQNLNIRRDGCILYVDFSNPPVNLMTVQMVVELFDLAGSLARHHDTAAVVVASVNAEFFVAHFDLNDLVKVVGGDQSVPHSNFDDVTAAQALCNTLQTLPLVTIGV